MNSCILVAEIKDGPQLRYTADNQTPVTEMIVEFPGTRAEDPPSTLKVVAWRDLAQEVQQRCHPGDRIIIEGSLNMNTIDHPQGFKEKRAELTAQRIYNMATNSINPVKTGTAASSPPSNVVPLESRRSAASGNSGDMMSEPEAPPSVRPSPVRNPLPSDSNTGFDAAPADGPDYDPIPF